MPLLKELFYPFLIVAIKILLLGSQPIDSAELGAEKPPDLFSIAL
jgi:hypothetical protein